MAGMFGKVQCRIRGYVNNPDGTFSVKNRDGSTSNLTEPQYRKWCRQMGVSCPLDARVIGKVQVK